MDIHGPLSALGDVLKAVLPPGAVAAVVSVLFGGWFSHCAEQRLEQSKSLMREAEEQTKTRFSWLYENRAKAMMEIYRLAIKIDESTTWSRALKRPS